jgi:hypothetical protein
MVPGLPIRGNWQRCNGECAARAPRVSRVCRPTRPTGLLKVELCAQRCQRGGVSGRARGPSCGQRSSKALARQHGASPALGAFASHVGGSARLHLDGGCRSPAPPQARGRPLCGGRAMRAASLGACGSMSWQRDCPRASNASTLPHSTLRAPDGRGLRAGEKLRRCHSGDILVCEIGSEDAAAARNRGVPTTRRVLPAADRRQSRRTVRDRFACPRSRGQLQRACLALVLDGLRPGALGRVTAPWGYWAGDVALRVNLIAPSPTAIVKLTAS